MSLLLWVLLLRNTGMSRSRFIQSNFLNIFWIAIGHITYNNASWIGRWWSVGLLPLRLLILWLLLHISCRISTIDWTIGIFRLGSLGLLLLLGSQMSLHWICMVLCGRRIMLWILRLHLLGGLIWLLLLLLLLLKSRHWHPRISIHNHCAIWLGHRGLLRYRSWKFNNLSSRAWWLGLKFQKKETNVIKEIQSLE